MAENENKFPSIHNSTYGELYIVETEAPFERIEIQYVPEDLTPERKARFAGMNVIGRNNDILHYTGGEDNLPLVLDFYSTDESRSDVIGKIDWLKSLARNNGYNGKARSVKVVFGKIFRFETWVIESVVPKMSHFDPNHDWLPMRASVELSLKLDATRNFTIDDLRR